MKSRFTGMGLKIMKSGGSGGTLWGSLLSPAFTQREGFKPRDNIQMIIFADKDESSMSPNVSA